VTGQPSMVAGASAATIVHLGSYWLLRRPVVDATLAAADAR